MRFGVWTPLPHTIRPEPAMDAAIAELQRPGGGAGVDASFQLAVDVLRKAEDYGFETTLVAERYLGPDLEALMLSAAIATQTRRIEIMPAVHPGIVNPQVVAKMVATLDRLSGGRAALNVVNGWWQEEFNLFGNGAWLDHEDQRYRRMDEYLQVIKGLWTNDAYSLDGEFYRVERGALPTKPRQQPHPPLYTGSRSPAAKDIVARLCDVWFVSIQPGFRGFEENIAQVADDIRDMNARCRSYGRSVRYAISCHVICADTLAQAQEQGDELESYGRRNPLAAVPAKALGAGLVGTPDLIAERLGRYEALGIECAMLHFHPMLDGVETFARKVMPLLRPGRTGIPTGDMARATV
jgi:FMNH2-dependent dimethyl sulfone monooxygenase